ncbi:hypothetical protein K503DRAFT_770517 [Rhizopogon vinicolor AM-OR11-026]|uniref:C2H2-type domain-containing protein n=1 Tax=Rhizopogon vinicolor AM-OR11-026 TaxID=1314800 RepID=A0A1B7N0P6_9AGAM|nr:hypothetical protein K503DRAFT_770517 [Rhizopogon vinicolor AM-OR11-026]
MSFHLIHVDPHTLLQVQQSGLPAVVYRCEIQGVPCGLFVEGTTSAMSAHLRGHGIVGPDNASTSCTWGSCSKTFKRGSLSRHILTHLGVKVRCSVCRVVKCRRDLIRAHIKTSTSCHFASAETVDGPEGYIVAPMTWSAIHQV